MNVKRGIVDELHKSARKNFNRRRVIIKHVDDLWEADLVDMSQYANENKKHNFMLTVIDAFSKFAWVIPIKNKTSESVMKAMRSIFLKNNQSPVNLHTDNGKEFFNQSFKSLMNEFKVNHYATYSTMKASIVERFNRTIKGKMWRKFSYNGNFKWINIIEKLTEEYNNSIHRTIQMKPKDGRKPLGEQQILKKEIFSINDSGSLQKKKENLRIGDYVRISKYKNIFEKGYTPNWTTEIFQIDKINKTTPITYLLKDYENTIVKGAFYKYELSKTAFPDKYLVEKILRKHHDKLYVKWLGFSPSHNSWITSYDMY